MSTRSKKILASLLGLLLVTVGAVLFYARMALFPVWYKPIAETAENPVLPACSSYQKRVYEICPEGDSPATLAAQAKKMLGGDHDAGKLWLELFEGVRPAREMGISAGERDVRVTGWWIEPIGKARGAVVLIHGAGADRRAMMKHARYLLRERFAVAMIDCHNHGMTLADGRGISYGWMESRSALIALDWVRQKTLSKLPIFLMGTSQGGFTSLLAGAMAQEKGIPIAGVISENPYASVRRIFMDRTRYRWIPGWVRSAIGLVVRTVWGGPTWRELDLANYTQDLVKLPLLLIHPMHDKVVPVQDSQDIAAMLKQAGAKRLEVWIPEKGEHEAVWNAQGPEYEARILEFLFQSMNAHG